MLKLVVPRCLYVLLPMAATMLLHPVRGQNFSSSNLPIFVLDTHGATIVDDPKIPAEIGIIYNGTGNINTLTDPFNEFEGHIAIEIRGSSSQMFPKKQYGIELTDEHGDGIDAALLGMPEEEDWVLFAPYNDKSLMRDVLAYKLGRDMGRYAPRTHYFELVLNGQYQGVYVLIEKIKRDKNRVDINKLDPDENDGDDVTGGYIIKIDKMTGDTDPGWVSSFHPVNAPSKEIQFLYEEPDAKDITAAQKQYIQNFMNEFEQVLNGDDFDDPVNGYTKYIDVPSFIDYMIMNEVAKNVDGYRLSTFIHKQRDSDGGKLVMGPIWDFNLGFGNADYCTSGAPEGLVLDFNNICPTDNWLIPFWWERLLSSTSFRMKVAARWEELRANKFDTGSILQYIDSTAAVLSEAQVRNFQTWQVLGQYVWPNYYVGATFQSEVNWLKDWIADRMAWLDVQFGVNLTTGESGTLPSHFAIRSYSNPFSKTLKVQYAVGKPCTVSFQLYNSIGNSYESASAFHEEAGVYETELGSSLPAGFYYCVVTLDEGSKTVVRLIKRN